MSDFNAHGLDPLWVEPKAEEVQAFFDKLSEGYLRDEPVLIRDTSKEELDYIAARAVEAALAKEAGSRHRRPLIEDVGDESFEEEVEADDPSATGKRRALQRAGSGEPVRPGKTVQRQQVPEQSVRQTRAAATKAATAKKVVKTAVAKKKATASSSSKRRRTPSPSPPPSDSTLETDFDLGSFSPKRKRKPVEEEAENEDTETLAQRAAKRAKASTGDKPPVGSSRTPAVVEISPDNSPRRSPRFSPQRGERLQEEPPRANPNTPPPSTTPPRGASPARASTTEPTHMEEEGASLSAGGFVPATNVGGEGATSSQPGADPSSAESEDRYTIIKEVAKDAEAEAGKITVEEAAKAATKEAAKGPAGEAGKAAAKGASEAATGAADRAAAEKEVANDQPPSPPAPAPGRYLKVGDGLFIHLPGTAGTRAPAEREVFDDEALATAGLQKLQALHRARLDKAKSRMAAADKAGPDLEERIAKTQAWFREAQEGLKAA
nr:serine/arginine repetitive matrix protein 1-like [Aegilops tauschii subsp. strangulata]